MRAVLYPACLFVLLGTLACKPEIGDSCDLDSDCSSAGDRLCDTTQPGGYCTMFNCEPGTCPDEATCIGFRTTVSALPTDDDSFAGWACNDLQGASRFQRTFCLRRCKSDSDCRGGYDCVDMRVAGNPYGAVVVERGGSGKVCAVPNKAGEIPYTSVPGVCEGNPGISMGGASAGGASSTAGGSVSDAGGGGRAGSASE